MCCACAETGCPGKGFMQRCVGIESAMAGIQQINESPALFLSERMDAAQNRGRDAFNISKLKLKARAFN